MNKILVIDPGKGWGQFVSKMYCYQKLANHLNSKITFLTKKSTQAEHYLKSLSFCEDVLYIEESKKVDTDNLYHISPELQNVLDIRNANYTPIVDPNTFRISDYSPGHQRVMESYDDFIKYKNKSLGTDYPYTEDDKFCWCYVCPHHVEAYKD